MSPKLLILKNWVSPSIFAALVVASTVAFWPNLPTLVSQIAISGLTAVVLITIFRKSSHDLLRTFLVAYSSLFASILFERGIINESVIVIIYGVLIFLLGLFVLTLKGEKGQTSIIEWLITCLISAQLLGLFLFWPISYFNRTLLVVVTFYMVWRFIDNKDASIGQLLLHFIFTGVIAIVILGGIIWANFPHLLP